MTSSLDLGVRPVKVWLLEGNSCRHGKFADDGRAVGFRSALFHCLDLLLGDFELQELLRRKADAVAVGIVRIGAFGFSTLAVDFRCLALVFGLRPLLLRSGLRQSFENLARGCCLSDDDFHDFDVDALGLHELAHLGQNDTLDFSENVFPFLVELAGCEGCHRRLGHFIAHRSTKQFLEVLLVPVRAERCMQFRGLAGDRPDLDVCIEVDRDVVDSDRAILDVIEPFRELDRARVVHDDVRRVEQPLRTGGVGFLTNTAVTEHREERLVDEDGLVTGLDLHPLRDHHHEGDEQDERDCADDALLVVGPEIELVFMAVAHGISFQWLWCQKNRKCIRNLHIIA